MMLLAAALCLLSLPCTGSSTAMQRESLVSGGVRGGGGGGQRCEAVARLFAGEVPPRDIPGLPRCGVLGESAWVDELTRRAENMEAQTATARQAAESGGAGIGGVGLLLRADLRVSVVEQSSSAHGKILAGDRLVSVDGVDVVGLTDQEAVVLLRGAIGTAVQVVVERPDGARASHSLPRRAPPLARSHVAAVRADAAALEGAPKDAPRFKVGGVRLTKDLVVEAPPPATRSNGSNGPNGSNGSPGATPLGGLRAGDRLVSVDGVRVTGIAPDKVMKLFEGPRASTVEILVLRRGAPGTPGELVVEEACRLVSTGEGKGAGGEGEGEGVSKGGKFGRLLSSFGLGLGK